MNNPAHSIAVLNCGGNANRTRTEPYRTVPSRAEPYRTMQWKSAISQLVQFGASERISQVNWFSSGLRARYSRSLALSRSLSLSRSRSLSLALALSRSLALARALSLSLSLALTHSLTTVHSVSRTARSRRLEGKLHDQPPTAERNTPSSLYTQNTSHLPDEARHSKYQKHLQSKHLP